MTNVPCYHRVVHSAGNLRLVSSMVPTAAPNIGCNDDCHG